MRSYASLSLVLLLAGAATWVGFGCGGDDTGSSNSTTSTGTAASGGGAGTGGSGTGGNGTGGTGAGTGVGGNGSGGSGGLPPPTTISECQGHVYECGDLVDNDNDGLLDYLDPDCLGPCDNTENSFYGGIPGQTGAACIVDCYFDQDSGSGNDECYWNHRCDPHEVAPDYYPESWNGSQCEYDPNANTPGTSGSCDELYTTQTQTCYDVCGPLTPNGCDCFGCCELPAGGGQYVWLGSEDGSGNGSCTLADLADPTKCQPCLPVQACLNGCGPCEICIGKPEPDPGCDPGGTGGGGGGVGGGAGVGGGGTTAQCPGGETPCGLPGQAACPLGFYCITGCCQEVPQ